jgi:preprotein translocase subunit SecA
MFSSMEVRSLEEVERLRELAIVDVVEEMEIDIAVIRLVLAGRQSLLSIDLVNRFSASLKPLNVQYYL